MIGGPSKEHGTNMPPATRRVQERSKGDTTCLTTSQNPSRWHPSWLSDACATRKDSESEWLAKDNLETNPINIKPKFQTMWQSSPPGFPYLLLAAWAPLPNKISCFVSTCVSLDNLSPCVRQELILGPWKGSPFLQQLYHFTFSPTVRKSSDFWKDNLLNGRKYLQMIWPIKVNIKCT